MKIYKNISLLFFSQCLGMLIPLIELPILTRRLGQESYGLVVYALSISLLISVFIEFGFSFSASAKYIKIQDNKDEISQLISDVFFSKILLFLIMSLPLFIYLLFFNKSLSLVWIFWISISSLAFGLSPIWYFLATESLFWPTILDLIVRSIGVTCLYLFISNETQALNTLIIYSIVGILNSLLPSIIMLTRGGFGHFKPERIFQTIKESFHFFLYKSAQNMNSSMSSTLLGSLYNTAAVGLFTPTEKIVRLIIGFSTTILNVAFPVIAKKHNENKPIKKFISLIVLSNFLIMSIGVLILYLNAETLITLVFGSGFIAAAPYLQTFIWALPLRSTSITLSILWFLPSRKEKVSSTIMIFNTLGIIFLSLILIPKHGVNGLIAAILILEFITVIILVTLFFRSKTSPL